MAAQPTITTRAVARARGAKRYFTGKPCPRGHVADRFVSSATCEACIKERADTVPAATKRAYRQRWNDANPGKTAAAIRAWQIANPERLLVSGRKWKAVNKDRAAATNRARYRADPAVGAARVQAWRSANPEKVREIRQRSHEKRRACPQKRLESAIRAGVNKALPPAGKYGKRTFALLGYTSAELRNHLERQFTEGMTWDNYGRGGWHVDHIIPLSAHNYKLATDPDFHRAWALSNLQPLWEADNIRKGASLERPFQPSFAL